jgi:hypothetical protein
MEGWPQHHVTGSVAAGYLDPELLFTIPRGTHDDIHRLWRAARIDDRDALLAGPVLVARNELRLRRLGPTLQTAAVLLLGAVVCGASGPIVLAVAAFLFLLAGHVDGWANELADHLANGVIV